jgi:hypothetical protein
MRRGSVTISTVGHRLSRREVLVVVLTHLIAFASPVILAVGAVLYIKPRVAGVTAFFAEEYSRQLANFYIAAGDDRAAVAGLRRHLDRVASIRRQVPTDRSRDDYLTYEDCNTASEIAVLSEPDEHEARMADAAGRCSKVTPGRTVDLSHWLGIAGHWVKILRGQE